MKLIALALPIALVLGLAACDRPSRTAQTDDPARNGIATRPSSEATSPRAETAAPSPARRAQSVESSADAPVADATLGEKVRQALLNEHGLTARDLQVTAQNGVVTLSGKVDEKSDSERMMLVAMSVDGVRSVVSNLVVDRPA
jgi:hyperosmotically inducible protein